MPSRRRRRQTAGLRRGAGRRAKSNGDRLSQPCFDLVQQLGKRMPQGDERQRARELLQSVRQGVPFPRAEAQQHQAQHRTNQRQERAVHTDLPQGMALRDAVPELQERYA